MQTTHGHIIEDARVLMQCFDFISFCFVQRKANRVAYILASLMKSFIGLHVWVKDVPPNCYLDLTFNCNFDSS